MVKKAGIVLAISAAGLLAASPLAVAGDYSGGSTHHSDHDSDHDGDHDDHGDDDDDDGDHDGHCGCDDDRDGHDDGDRRWDHRWDHRGARPAGSLLNISDIAVQVPIQACNNSVISGVLGIASSRLRDEDSHDGQCHQRTGAR